MNLTKEERAILESVERAEWRRVPDFPKDARRYQTAARATLRKDIRVNIRMSEMDLSRFRKKAAEEGLPYQTLIASVLHKYINGRLESRA
jgi:predicted DNA binding CopG/RHH family protein